METQVGFGGWLEKIGIDVAMNALHLSRNLIKMLFAQYGIKISGDQDQKQCQWSKSGILRSIFQSTKLATNDYPMFQCRRGSLGSYGRMRCKKSI